MCHLISELVVRKEPWSMNSGGASKANQELMLELVKSWGPRLIDEEKSGTERWKKHVWSWMAKWLVMSE